MQNRKDLTITGFVTISQNNSVFLGNGAKWVARMQKAPGSCLAASPGAYTHITTQEKTEGNISIHWRTPAVKEGH